LHRSGRWRVVIPAKWSGTGRQRDRYFANREEAERFIADTLREREQYGAQAVTPEERQWVAVLRSELGDLDTLRDVLAHWRRTGRVVQPTAVKGAVERFLAFRKTDKLNPGTASDIEWRLNAFSPPETPGGSKRVYSPEEFNKLLNTAYFWEKRNEQYACLYIALAGLAFMRSQELVRRFEGEPVLEWTDIRWDRREIVVREGVAKSARQKGENTRVCPIHDRLSEWLERLRPDKLEGQVVDLSVRAFRRRLREVHRVAEVPFIDNGLRKSAISYWLAGNKYGIGQVSEWAGNSEASARAHYLKVLTSADHDAWFSAAG
jgi:integrase